MFRDESISTLKFANRAKQIKNKPIVNEVHAPLLWQDTIGFVPRSYYVLLLQVLDQASLLKRYRQQIKQLKSDLKIIEDKVILV